MTDTGGASSYIYSRCVGSHKLLAQQSAEEPALWQCISSYPLPGPGAVPCRRGGAPLHEAEPAPAARLRFYQLYQQAQWRWC
jgi:hypothetical protein